MKKSTPDKNYHRLVFITVVWFLSCQEGPVLTKGVGKKSWLRSTQIDGSINCVTLKIGYDTSRSNQKTHIPTSRAKTSTRICQHQALTSFEADIMITTRRAKWLFLRPESDDDFFRSDIAHPPRTPLFVAVVNSSGYFPAVLTPHDK